MRISKIILILIILGVLLPSFSFSQEQLPIKPPETMQEAKEMGERVLKITWQDFPGIIKKVWQEEVLPFWQKIWRLFKSPWELYLKPWLENIWLKIKFFLGYEIETRKPIIEEELQKEKQELKTETKEMGKSLWQKFKEIIK